MNTSYNVMGSQKNSRHYLKSTYEYSRLIPFPCFPIRFFLFIFSTANINPTDTKRRHFSNNMFEETDSRILNFAVGALFRDDKPTMTMFDTVLSPEHLKIYKYLERFRKYMKSGPLVPVTTAVLLRRIHAVNSRLFSRSSAHRLVLATYVLAIKWCDDVYVSNAYYAKVGGIELEELNCLETHALQCLDYQCACMANHRQETVEWANALSSFWHATSSFVQS